MGITNNTTNTTAATTSHGLPATTLTWRQR
jgi:hypothetical protein